MDERLAGSVLDVVPEAQLALFIFGTRHIRCIAYPTFPDRSHSRPIDRALSLNGIGRVRRLPFAFGARFTGPLFLMELTFFGCHGSNLVDQNLTGYLI
jgi:hypothetical protein